MKKAETEVVDTNTGEILGEENKGRRRKKKEDEPADSGSILQKLATKVSASFLNDINQASKVDKYISTGSTLLDLALGGGWGVGRIVNIVGDESTGKSLLAGEAIAYTQRKLKGIGVYDDAETTFESDRAATLGVNVSETITPESNTVEDFFNNVEKLCDELPKLKNAPVVTYVLDSMDAVSTEAELERAIGQATFGSDKAKRMSEFFRRLAKKMSKIDMTLIIISQTRDKIGVMFGEKKDISGGKALKFYSSQRLMLSECGKIKVKIDDGTEKGIEKIVGIKVRAKVIKNKLNQPFEEVTFNILFNYGIDDIESCVTWLYERTDALGDVQGWYTWTTGEKFRKDDLVKYIEDNNLEEDLKTIARLEWAKLEAAKSNDTRKKKYD